MNAYELIRLDEFTQELKRLQTETGFWLQNAEVYSLAQTEPIAKIGAGGGQYCVQLLGNDS